jgi:hypothetical protein
MLLIALVVPTMGVAQQNAPHSYVPPDGFVPDSATAVRIAEAIWLPIYGKNVIDDEHPFRAVLKDGVWTVTGTLSPPPPGLARLGGVALAEISQKDGRILRVSHGR